MLMIFGAVAGALFGYLTGRYMSGFGFGCPLICNPKISVIYFAIIGLIMAAGK